MPLKLVQHKPSPIDSLYARVAEVSASSKADNTRRCYTGAWRAFEVWAKENSLQAIPAAPLTLAMYLCYLADQGCSLSKIGLARAAVLHEHYRSDLPFDKQDTQLCNVMAGLSRINARKVIQKKPITRDILGTILAPIGNDLTGLRDRALLLLGWHGAYRRSELCGIDIYHVTVKEDGLIIYTPRSKTDQTGNGYSKAIPRSKNILHCPISAYTNWIGAAGIKGGAVFRNITQWDKVGDTRLSNNGLAWVLKSRCERVGIDPRGIGGHSLRSGWVTSAAEAGIDPVRMSMQTGHRRLEVLRGYIRSQDILDKAPGRGLL